MAQKDPLDLQGALRASVVPVSVKSLKKKGVTRVKVIERDRLVKALLAALDQQRPAAPTSGEVAPQEKKRVELLLIELEKISKAKTQLEHEKGLLEADKSRLSAELDRIAQEISRNTGQKVKPEEVKNLLDDLERIREDRDKTRKSLDRALQEGERRIEAEMTRAKTAEEALAATQNALTAKSDAYSSLTVERDGLAARAAKLDEAEAEVARLSDERARFADRNLQLERTVKQLQASYDATLRELEAAAPILAAHRDAQDAAARDEAAARAEAEENAAQDAAAARVAKGASLESVTRPEAAPRSLGGAAAPARQALPLKTPPSRRIPGFGFSDAPAAPAASPAPPRTRSNWGS